MSDLRSFGNDLPFIRLQERREWSLERTSNHEAMEHGCSNLTVWPPMCWCEVGQMSIRQVYPMARAYITHGEPLYAELKAPFSPDDAAENDPLDDDELIIIVDSDDEEDLQPHPFQFLQALPAP
ncbi:hypothetical protein ACS0TY_007907 [Phlomoides rotata]